MKLLALLKSVLNWVYEGGKTIGDAETRLYFDSDKEKKPIMWSSHGRSLAKSLSWRVFGNLISFIIVYGLTHNGKLALAASAIELVVKIVLYYYHERIWNKIKWGREES